MLKYLITFVLNFEVAFTVVHFLVHNSTAKSYKDTCEKQESAHHWYLGSITQITVAAVDITLGECDPRYLFLAEIIVAQ